MKKMYRTKDGFDVIIMRETKNRYIMYCEDYGYMFSIYKKAIEKPFFLLIEGFGYIKTNDVDYVDGISKRPAWSKYKSMLKRVYSGHERYKAYYNVAVCDEWRDFVNFERWFNNNYVEGFAMDKDFLSKPDNKIYSPETCCFIPKSINSIVNRTDSVLFRNGRYGFYVPDGAVMRYIPVGTKEEAERFKKVCGRIAISTLLWEHRYSIKSEVSKKILSLYD